MNSNKEHIQATVYFILISLIWGSGFILMKKASMCYGPLYIALGRVSLAALILNAITISQKKVWLPQKRDWIKLAPLVILGYAFPFTFQPFLIGYMGSAMVGSMLIFVPIFSLFVSVLLLGQKLKLRQSVGIFCGLVFCLLLAKANFDLKVSKLIFMSAILVPLGYAFNNTLIKKWFEDINPLPFTGLTCLLASLVIAPIALIFDEVKVDNNIWLASGALLILGFLMSGLALFWFYHLIMKYGPVKASIVSYIIPIVAFFWGISDNEPYSGFQFLCILGILGSLYLTKAKKGDTR